MHQTNLVLLYFYRVFILFLLFFLNSSLLLCQSTVLKWIDADREGRVYNYPTNFTVTLDTGYHVGKDADTNSKPCLSLRPSEKTAYNHRVLTFSTPLSHLLLPIRYSIYSSKKDVAHIAVDICVKGYRKDGDVVYPSITLSSKEEMDEHIQNGCIRLESYLANPLLFYFDGDVEKVEIDWGSEAIGFQVKLRVDDISFSNEPPISLPNPSLRANVACTYKMTALLDCSSSISINEQLAIAQQLQSTMDKFARDGAKVNLNVISFGKETKRLDDFNAFSDVSGTTALKQYEALAHDYHSSTEWQKAFEEVIKSDGQQDVVLLITDGVPGGVNTNETQQEHFRCIELSNILKSQGTRIIAIGLDDINKQNIDFWLRPLSGEGAIATCDIKDLSNEIFRLINLCVVTTPMHINGVLSPNPAYNDISFKFELSNLLENDYRLTIYNGIGQEQTSFKLTESSYTFSVKDLPNGMYFSTLRLNDEVIWSNKFEVLK